MLLLVFFSITFIVFGRCLCFWSQDFDPWPAHRWSSSDKKTAAVFQRLNVESEAINQPESREVMSPKKELQFKSFFLVTANLCCHLFLWPRLVETKTSSNSPLHTCPDLADRSGKRASRSRGFRRLLFDGRRRICLDLPTTQDSSHQ